MTDPVAIKKYLMKRVSAQMAELASHFQAEPEVLEPMLQFWINKGKVRKIHADSRHCSGCAQCMCQSVSIYEWIG